MKYAIEYLPSAPEDLKEIVRYIAHTLQNPKAAERLWLEIIKKTDLLADFPYSAPRYLRETEHRFG
ncbi:type II toxin-antitoxin system RelE/ParE family toxin [Treponema socranskii]|uniref:type II toxin-antitoxin system RelE/ParE family toxin n=1 Tax=Treponema socranskii TaxID=53419 RepID=UPI003D6DAE28